MAPFARIQCSAALVSRPPENAMPTFWPTGRSLRMFDMGLGDAREGRYSSRRMPELPDLEAYRHALAPRIVGQPIERVVVAHPFLLRTAAPPIDTVVGRKVVGVRRLGKRIALALEGELFVVVHLMIAGRFQWLAKGAKPPG